MKVCSWDTGQLYTWNLSIQCRPRLYLFINIYINYVPNSLNDEQLCTLVLCDSNLLSNDSLRNTKNNFKMSLQSITINQFTST